MKIFIEEYGEFILSSIIGFVVVGIGVGMVTALCPLIEKYIVNLM